MITCELRFLLKSNSDHKACNDQTSLGDLLANLRRMADDLGLDFSGAYLQAGSLAELRDALPFYPCI
jgi:hypothetical protein